MPSNLAAPIPRASTRPRVLLVPEWYPSKSHPVLGTFIREQARAISLRADVTVAYFDDDEAPGRGLFRLREEQEDGVRVIRVAQRSMPGKLSAGLRLAALEAVIRRLSGRGLAPDVLHGHVFSAGFPAVVLGALHRVPVVVSENYTGFPRRTLGRWDRQIARFTFGHADLTCPASEDLRRHMEALGIKARFRVVPNTVDMSLFAPADAPRAAEDGRRSLLTVAMLDPKKGIEFLLEAMATLRSRHDDVDLQIVGDGPIRSRLESRARELGLQQAVTFHGIKGKAEVAELLRAADLFVLPSLWENLPNVIIEALATGTPVVATAVGGVPEMVGPEDGALVPAGDPAALAAAVGETLERIGEFDSAAIAGRARERYGFEAVSATWEEIYRDLIGA